MGNKDKIDGVFISVAEKWVESVEWVLIVKLVLGDRLADVFSA